MVKLLMKHGSYCNTYSGNSDTTEINERKKAI
jgi:hypothetical protein